MNPEKWLDERYTCFIYEAFLADMGDSLPNVRELRIQTAKWARLLDYPVNTGVGAFALLSVNTTAPKKLSKEQGERNARIIKQGKKVRQMLKDSLKAMLKVEWPKSGKKYTNKEFSNWNNRLNEGIAYGKNMMRRRVLQKMLTGKS